MFVMYEKDFNVPIKVWLQDREQIEENCLEQAYHLAKLPFLHKWACLMPDTHAGMGMPIGGVLATKDVIIPNAVGVDIGCGMVFMETNLKLSDISEIQTGNGTIIQGIVGDILRSIPVGFSHHKEVQTSETLDRAKEELSLYEKEETLVSEIEEGYFQIGTLGGGNHFIELQADEEGYLGIMIHSGSRHFGKKVCDYFHQKARELNIKWHSKVPDEYRLAFLPVDTTEGEHYIRWMNLCLDFAHENREHMMLAVKEIVARNVQKHAGITVEFKGKINCHHNYAALENHFGKNVWVHRKGATRAREGELAVIPGAMGSFSYVVRGLGNADSFYTSSHGAGRKYSRKGAMEAFTCEKVMVDLKQQGVILGKRSKADVAEESRFAYKDIDEVMENQKDIVTPIKKLKTVGVVKG